MSRARVTHGDLADGSAPRCPHCRARMDGATITLGDLLASWPVPRFVAAESDGYAWPRESLTVDCPECARASYLTVSEKGSHLVAARTAADCRYIDWHFDRWRAQDAG